MKYQKATTYERAEVAGNLTVMPGHFNCMLWNKFYCLCYVRTNFMLYGLCVTMSLNVILLILSFRVHAVQSSSSS